MSKSDAGKGDDDRVSDYKKYWTNVELISGKPFEAKPQYKKVIVRSNGKTTYVY